MALVCIWWVEVACDDEHRGRRWITSILCSPRRHFVAVFSSRARITLWSHHCDRRCVLVPALSKNQLAIHELVESHDGRRDDFDDRIRPSFLVVHFFAFSLPLSTSTNQLDLLDRLSGLFRRVHWVEPIFACPQRLVVICAKLTKL